MSDASYQPKLGDVVRVRDDYQGGFKNTHKQLIGVVWNHATPEPSKQNTWLVQFGDVPGHYYHADEIEPLPVGARILFLGNGVVGVYEGIAEPWPAQGLKGNTVVLRVQWEGGPGDVVVGDRTFLDERIPNFDQSPGDPCSHLGADLIRIAGTLYKWEFVQSHGRHGYCRPCHQPVKPKSEPIQQHFVNAGASCNEIAWLLFITDPRVIEFVAKVADPFTRVRAFKVAWGRDEHGWRTEHTRRAREMASYPINRESEWALPGSWAICTCPTVETPDEGFKVMGRSPTCKKHEFEAP
jgi:hypothetical protein